MSTLQVEFKHDQARIPVKGSPESAGYDVFSVEDAVVEAWDRKIVSTGLTCRPPPGTYIRVAPRSGLSVKKRLDVAAGVVDADYRGMIGVVLVNNSSEAVQLDAGTRIAQLILEKIVTDAEIVVVEDLDRTERGAGGFGSTGGC